MKKYNLFLWLCCMLIPIFQSTGQTYQPDGSVQVGNTENTFEFNNAIFRYTDILTVRPNMTGGIIGTINAGGGYIILEVYTSDKKQLLYKKTLTTSSTSFGGNTENTTWQGKPIATDQIKTLASAMSFQTKEGTPSEITNPSFLKASLYAYEGNYFFRNPYSKCLKDNNFKNEQNVYVRIKAKLATVKRIRYPGQGDELVMGDLNPDKQFSVTIFINGVNNGTVTSKVVPTFNAKVGDDIQFVFNNTYPEFKRKPIFEGIPAVWKAHFAGETKYYCTPSIQPNDIKAWLGFDSQVHGTLLRRYPNNYKERYPDFTTDASGNIASWSFTLQREMDPDKTIYTPTYEWPKQKTTPVIQRNNQKEGLNMELLRMNNDRTYSAYQGLPYLLGSDPDEIYYLDGQKYDTKTFPPNHGLLLKTKEVWKQVPFEESKDPVNDMVVGYLKNRHTKYGDNSKVSYEAYEIQDNGTSQVAPDGTGTGNNKAPGLCSITLGGNKISFKLNVTNPLSNQNGFYANIDGTRWPGWDENEPYTIKGLSGLSINELKSYVVVYTNENSIANVNSEVFKFSSLSDADLTNISKTGFYVRNFRMSGNGYNNITLYKYNQAKTDSTIIGGKELLTIVLRFVTVPKNANVYDLQLNEVSDGGYIYLEEFRNERKDDPLYIPLYGRYAKKFVRDYTLQKGSTITFLTLDSDPYTFYNDGLEWYLSSRYQAKRLPVQGTESQKTFVKYYLDELNADGSVKTLSKNPVGTGSTFTYQYDNEGDFQLRVEYRNSNIKCYHHIKVVNYTDETKGNIKIRELTDKEKKFLGFYEGSYMMAEVNDVLAKYKFVDGYRSQNPPNRFGKYNDYYEHYKWTDVTYGTTILNPSSVREILRNYNETSWLPKTWVRHFSDKPYPKDINPSLFKQPEDEATYIQSLYNGVPEPWQVRLPWAPITQANGARYRTNIKVIYNMNQFFDNLTGAFSGNPKAISSKDVYNNFITDDQEDNKELWHDLMNGQKIIVYKNIVGLKVENYVDEASKPIFIAGWINPKSGRSLLSSTSQVMVNTLPITSTLNASVFSVNPIVESGFVYRYRLGKSSWKFIKSILKDTLFTAEYTDVISPNTLYEVKPYIITKNDTIYGHFTQLITMPSDSIITYKYGILQLHSHLLINDDYVSYQWYKNGKPIEQETHSEYSISANKSSDIYSCVATTTDGTTVVVYPFKLDVEYMNTSGDDIGSFSKSIIYPNPVARGSNINIKIDPSKSIKQINLYNSVGNIIKTINGYTSFLSTNGLATGSYVLQILSDDNQIEHLNFIVY